MRKRTAAGFTLLEMLVALSVFAMAAVALLHLSGESTRTAVIVEEQVLAGIVADNLAVDASVEAVSDLRTPASGTTTLGSREWRWSRTALPTADADLLQVRVQVGMAGETRVAASVDVFRSLR